MKISITGGTGFVGREVTRELLDLGHRVRLVTRFRARPGVKRPDGNGVEIFSGIDFSNSDQLAEAFAGTPTVIHLVGIISECGSQTFERVHLDLTSSALTAAQASGVRRFVHMSALGTRSGARSRYHQTKWAAEERVRAAPLDWTVFRPSLVYGARDGFTRLFARLSSWSPVLPVIGAGTCLLQPISVQQVARAFARAVATPESVGQTYDLCGRERLTMIEILKAILEAHGRRRGLVHVPLPLARFQAVVLERLYPTLLRQAPPLNRDQLLILQEDNIGDGAPADQAFGLEHRAFADDMRRLAAREFDDLAMG